MGRGHLLISGKVSAILKSKLVFTHSMVVQPDVRMRDSIPSKVTSRDSQR